MRLNGSASYINAVNEYCNKLHPAQPEDYKKDGLLYCGKCHTPREKIQQIPNTDIKITVNVACECRLAEREQKNAERLIEIIESNRKQALPYEKYRSMTFANSDTPLPFAKNYVDKWNHLGEIEIQQIRKKENGAEEVRRALSDSMYHSNVGLLLHGSVGCGKTYIAAAIANALVDRGEWVYMNNMASISSELRDNYKGGHAFIMERAQLSHLFVIDDFGTECTTDYSLQNTYELIEARVESGKPFIVTTNLSPTNLTGSEDVRLQRLYSRLTSLHPIGVTGADRRKTSTRERYSDLNKILGIGEAT